jgi:hypothetical protein
MIGVAIGRDDSTPDENRRLGSLARLGRNHGEASAEPGGQLGRQM